MQISVTQILLIVQGLILQQLFAIHITTRMKSLDDGVALHRQRDNHVVRQQHQISSCQRKRGVILPIRESHQQQTHTGHSNTRWKRHAWFLSTPYSRSTCSYTNHPESGSLGPLETGGCTAGWTTTPQRRSACIRHSSLYPITTLLSTYL